MRRLTFLLALFALPGSAGALTYNQAEVYYSSLSVLVLASDGFSERTDSWVRPATQAAEESVAVDEVGTLGAIDPLRSFAGSVLTSPTDLAWMAAAPGAQSGRVASIAFDSFSVLIDDHPVAGLRASGLPFKLADVATEIRLRGRFLFGADVVPFDATLSGATVAQGSRDPSGVDRILWITQAINRPIFETRVGGVTYTGRLWLDQKVLVPEPNVALLLGLGLLIMAAVGCDGGHSERESWPEPTALSEPLLPEVGYTTSRPAAPTVS